MLLPLCNRVGVGDAGAEEDSVPELAEGELGRIVGEDQRGPCGRGCGDDGPVDGVLGNQLQRWLVGLGDGGAGAGDLLGVLAREQRWISAGDGHARRAGLEGSGDSVIEPCRRVVEAVIGRELVSRERRYIVRQDGGDELRAGLVGVFGDAADKRQSVRGSGEEQLLA